MSIEDLPRTIDIAEDGSCVRIIDQTALPAALSLVEIRDWREMVEAVKRLEVRGAPALGIAGAAALSLFAVNEYDGPDDIDIFLNRAEAVCEKVSTARPTAVNLAWGTLRALEAARAAKTVDEARMALARECHALRAEDEASCRAIGQAGASLFSKPSALLTHCNAGSLATAFYGTALGVVYAAWERGLVTRVFADETRPVGQGARLTAWELGRVGVPTTLICDNMAASIMAQGKIDAVVVGADRICANGDTANKIGTYGLAILAHHHGIPFYVAAPRSTFDPSLSHGSEIPIEHRSPSEFGYPAPEGVTIHNPTFDVTPANLISAFVTDTGVYEPHEIGRLICAAGKD